jgi:hypothetical protein
LKFYEFYLINISYTCLLYPLYSYFFTSKPHIFCGS